MRGGVRMITITFASIRTKNQKELISMTRSRFLPSLAFVLLSMDAHALGIGEIINQPRLGERLRIELRLHADDAPIDPACIRLSPGDSGDDLPWVRGARLRLQGGLRPSLIVESNEVVTHPIYMLGLRIGCGAEVRREFTMMPQPPVELPTAAPAPVPTQNAPTRPATVDMIEADRGNDRGGWTVVAGETLASIAAALFPDSLRSQKSFVRETVRANRRLFANVADPANHPLPAGENLMLPGSGTRASAPPRVARQSVARAASEGRKPREDQAAAEPRVQAHRSEPVRNGEDRLMVASGSASESGLKFSTLLNDARSRGLSEEQREKLRQEQRLIAQLDEKIIASLALAEKIRNMEDYLEKLQGDMSRLDQQIKSASGAATAGGTVVPTPPAPSAEPAPTPAQRQIEPTKATPRSAAKASVESEGIDWKIYGAIAAAFALLGTLWWRSRQSADDGFEPHAEPSPEAPETEIPQSVPAVEPTLAQQVPTQRVELAAPLELELEQPAEQESKIAVAEHDSALELAEIMLSFGRVQGAAQTLTDYIHSNPKQAIRPWLRLLEIYHGAGMQKEFDAVMEQFHQNFNVQSVSWSDYGRELSRTSIEGMPHLIQEVVASWPSRGCLELLQNYLLDNREGTRNGFPLSIADDIATLVGILESRHIGITQSVAA